MSTSNSIYQRIFEFSPSPIAIFEASGACLLANQAFFFQLDHDFDGENQTGPRLEDLFHSQEAYLAFREHIKDRGVIRRWETNLKTGEANSLPVLLSARTLKYKTKTCYEISFTNITQLAKLQKSIRTGHHRVKSLIENLTAGLFLVDRKGLISDANTALGNLIQFEPENMIGEPYQVLFSKLIEIASETEVVGHSIREAVQNVLQRPEFELNLKEGQQFLELKLFPVWGEDGKSMGWGGLVQDVTEVRQQTMWKLELLSILAHDLRTPLATLKGHATALLANYQNWGSEMGLEFLKTIDRSVDELIRQVERNLALTRVETGRLGLRPEAIDSATLVDQAVERAAGSLGEREINKDIPTGLPQLRVDPARAEEVIINLLDNAARYTPPETPILIQARSSGNWLNFTVIDHGPGIPTGIQNEIFDKYVRGVGDSQGTGLGLYISRKIVEAHGGRIWVDSPPEGQAQGAAFTFTLPVFPDISLERLAPQESQTFETLELGAWDADGQKILVVEDETDVQTLLYTILTDAGFQVEIAPDGPSALDLIQVDAPDLVLLDWMLPGMRGLQVCRNIRRWSNVPIIMVTSKTGQADLIAALDAGADDYVTKPFQTDELLARIRAILRRGVEVDQVVADDEFKAHGLRIHYKARSVWLYDKKIDLTPTEFTLLAYLSRHRGQVLTYNQLIDAIGDPAEKRNRHRLFVHISRLRQKIEQDPKDPFFIQTQWGFGYVFLPRK